MKWKNWLSMKFTNAQIRNYVCDMVLPVLVKFEQCHNANLKYKNVCSFHVNRLVQIVRAKTEMHNVPGQT